MSDDVYHLLCHYYGLRSSLLQKKKACFWLSLSCHQAFARLLLAEVRVGVIMEQASGSIMMGTRAFSAHLPLTSLLLFKEKSLLWPSTASRLFAY